MGEDQTKLHLKEYLGELQGKRGAFSNKGIGQLITTLCSSMSSIPYPDENFLFIHEIGTVQTSNSSMMDYKFNPVLGGSSLQGGPPVSVLAMTFA
jgi:hypothetical protein